MSTIAQRMIAARTGTVEAAGLIWHIRIPSLADIIGAGAKHIPHLELPAREGEPVVTPDPQERASLVLDLLADAEAHACAWVTGVQESPSAPVEVLMLVPTLDDERPDDNRIWVGTVPPTVLREIVDGAAALVTDGGRLTRAVANFPPRSE